MAFIIPLLATIGTAAGAATATAALTGGMIVGSAGLSALSMYQQNRNAKRMAEAAKPAPLAPPPQASKAPVRTPLAAGAALGMGMAAPGSSGSTFLTGPSGIATGSLGLGKNMLLGG